MVTLKTAVILQQELLSTTMAVTTITKVGITTVFGSISAARIPLRSLLRLTWIVMAWPPSTSGWTPCTLVPLVSLGARLDHRMLSAGRPDLQRTRYLHGGR